VRFQSAQGERSEPWARIRNVMTYYQ
jgi:hypothetical protein